MQLKARRVFNIVVSLFISVNFILTPGQISAQSLGSTLMPVPGAMVLPSKAFTPMTLKGVTINPQDPFHFDFLIDTGDENYKNTNLKNKAKRLIEYFLVSLATPEEDMWVNLSPYERNRIMTDSLAQTKLGRELMAQDYLLKQLSSSLLHPNTKTGKAFWNEVYAKAHQQFGTTDIPMDTFHKIWIMPNKSEVYVHDNTVYITDSSLKVMLEEDLDLAHSVKGKAQSNNKSSELMRQIVLPAVEKEINHGKNFAQTRQIYNSIILATWYRDNIKQSLLNKYYTSQNKLEGLNPNDPSIREDVHEQYMQAFQKGVFNYIKEEMDVTTQEVVPRKYFSGGLHFIKPAITKAYAPMPSAILPDGAMIGADTNAIMPQLSVEPADQAMTAEVFGEVLHMFNNIYFGNEEWAGQFLEMYYQRQAEPGFKEAFLRVAHNIRVENQTMIAIPDAHREARYEGVSWILFGEGRHLDQEPEYVSAARIGNSVMPPVILQQMLNESEGWAERFFNYCQTAFPKVNGRRSTIDTLEMLHAHMHRFDTRHMGVERIREGIVRILDRMTETPPRPLATRPRKAKRAHVQVVREEAGQEADGPSLQDDIIRRYRDVIDHERSPVSADNNRITLRFHGEHANVVTDWLQRRGHEPASASDGAYTYAFDNAQAFETFTHDLETGAFLAQQFSDEASILLRTRVLERIDEFIRDAPEAPIRLYNAIGRANLALAAKFPHAISPALYFDKDTQQLRVIHIPDAEAIRSTIAQEHVKGSETDKGTEVERNLLAAFIANRAFVDALFVWGHFRDFVQAFPYPAELDAMIAAKGTHQFRRPVASAVEAAHEIQAQAFGTAFNAKFDEVFDPDKVEKSPYFRAIRATKDIVQQAADDHLLSVMGYIEDAIKRFFDKEELLKRSGSGIDSDRRLNSAELKAQVDQLEVRDINVTINATEHGYDITYVGPGKKAVLNRIMLVINNAFFKVANIDRDDRDTVTVTGDFSPEQLYTLGQLITYAVKLSSDYQPAIHEKIAELSTQGYTSAKFGIHIEAAAALDVVSHETFERAKATLADERRRLFTDSELTGDIGEQIRIRLAWFKRLDTETQHLRTRGLIDAQQELMFDFKKWRVVLFDHKVKDFARRADEDSSMLAESPDRALLVEPLSNMASVMQSQAREYFRRFSIGGRTVFDAQMITEETGIYTLTMVARGEDALSIIQDAVVGLDREWPHERGPFSKADIATKDADSEISIRSVTPRDARNIYNKLVEVQDGAMETKVNADTRGGMLFTRDAIDLQEQGAQININIDEAMITNIQNANGIIPRINAIRLIPTTQFLPMLGFRKEDLEAELAALN